MSARRTETTQEALAYTRRTLGPADPARGDEFNGAARTPEGRAVLARILADQPEARGHAKATRQLRSHAEAARQSRGHVREPRKPRVRVSGTRRRWLVAAATVMALGGVTAMADAMGVLPSGVVDGLTRVQDDGMGEVDLDRARLLVAGPMPDGRRTMEVWQAPNKSGGTCLHTRYVADDRPVAADPEVDLLNVVASQRVHVHEGRGIPLARPREPGDAALDPPEPRVVDPLVGHGA